MAAVSFRGKCDPTGEPGRGSRDLDDYEITILKSRVISMKEEGICLYSLYIVH